MERSNCFCWTAGHNRVATVVRGEKVVHKRECPNRPKDATCLEDIYDEESEEVEG